MEGRLLRSLGITAAVAVTSFGGAALAHRAGPPSWGYGMMGMGPGPWMSGRYRLTEEQWRKIEEIYSKYSDRILPFEKEVYSRSLELKAYISRPEAEPRKIKALLMEIRNLKGRIEDLKVDIWAEVAKVLTEEQRKYLGYIFPLGLGRTWDNYCPMMHGHMGWL